MANNINNYDSEINELSKVADGATKMIDGVNKKMSDDSKFGSVLMFERGGYDNGQGTVNKLNINTDPLADVPRGIQEQITDGTEAKRGAEEVKGVSNATGTTDFVRATVKDISSANINSVTKYHSNAEMDKLLGGGVYMQTTDRVVTKYALAREGENAGLSSYVQAKKQVEDYLEKQGINSRSLSDRELKMAIAGKKVDHDGNFSTKKQALTDKNVQTALKELQFLRSQEASFKASQQKSEHAMGKAFVKNAMEGSDTYEGFRSANNAYKTAKATTKIVGAMGRGAYSVSAGLVSNTERNALKFVNGVLSNKIDSANKEIVELNKQINSAKNAKEIKELRKARQTKGREIADNKARISKNEARIAKAKETEMRRKTSASKSLDVKIQEGKAQFKEKIKTGTRDAIEKSKFGKEHNLKQKRIEKAGKRQKKLEKKQQTKFYKARKNMSEKGQKVIGFFGDVTKAMKKLLIYCGGGLLICVGLDLILLAIVSIIPDFGFVHSDKDMLQQVEQYAVNKIWEEQLAYETNLYNCNASTPEQRAYGLPEKWQADIETAMVHINPNDMSSELVPLTLFAVYENPPILLEDDTVITRTWTDREGGSHDEKRLVHYGYPTDGSYDKGRLIGFAYADRMKNDYWVEEQRYFDETSWTDHDRVDPETGARIATEHYVVEESAWYMTTNGDADKWGILDEDDGAYDMEWTYVGAQSSSLVYDEGSALSHVTRYRDEKENTGRNTYYAYTNQHMYRAIVSCFYGFDEAYSFDETETENPEFAYWYMHERWLDILEHSAVTISGSDHIKLTYTCGLTNLMKWDDTTDWAAKNHGSLAEYNPALRSTTYVPGTGGAVTTSPNNWCGWFNSDGSLNDRWEIAQLFYASQDYWGMHDFVLPARTDQVLTEEQIEQILRQLQAQHVNAYRRHTVECALRQVGRFYYASDDMSYIHDLSNPQAGTDCNGLVSYITYLAGIENANTFYHSCWAFQACDGLTNKTTVSGMNGNYIHVDYSYTRELKPGTILSRTGADGNHTVMYVGLLMLPENGDTSYVPYVVESTWRTEKGNSGASLNHASWNHADSWYNGHYSASDPWGAVGLYGTG